MSEQRFHIGRTKFVVEARYGMHILSVSKPGTPLIERVAAFESEVAASRFVEALKIALTSEGVVWDVAHVAVPTLPLGVVRRVHGDLDVAADLTELDRDAKRDVCAKCWLVMPCGCEAA